MTVAEPEKEFAHDIAIANSLSDLALRPLRIALLGYRSHPFVGGQGIYIRYLSRALHQLGHQVTVFSGPPYPELDPGVELRKVPSLDLYAKANHVTALKLRHLKSFTDTWEWWTMLSGGFGEPYTFGRRVKKLLQQEKFDIIHDNQSLCHALVELQSQGHNVVATVHHPIHRDRDLALASAPNWKYRVLIRRWYSFIGMQQKVVERLKHVVTVSESSRRDIENYFSRSPEKTHIIANGVDTSVFRPLHNVVKNPFQIITTASADQPLKGLRYLLEALAELKIRHSNISLVVIGKLKPGGDTEKLLHKLSIADNVRFYSGISTESLVEKYNQSQIAVCPSLYEGFGLPAAEAMACGLPVVSTDGGALPEVIGDAGVVVPAGASEALVTAVDNLLQFPEKAELLARRARQRVLDHFSWQQVAIKLSRFYKNILEKNVDRSF